MNAVTFQILHLKYMSNIRNKSVKLDHVLKNHIHNMQYNNLRDVLIHLKNEDSSWFWSAMEDTRVSIMSYCTFLVEYAQITIPVEELFTNIYTGFIERCSTQPEMIEELKGVDLVRTFIKTVLDTIYVHTNPTNTNTISTNTNTIPNDSHNQEYPNDSKESGNRESGNRDKTTNETSDLTYTFNLRQKYDMESFEDDSDVSDVDDDDVTPTDIGKIKWRRR
jgi:hypothetical protein